MKNRIKKLVVIFGITLFLSMNFFVVAEKNSVNIIDKVNIQNSEIDSWTDNVKFKWIGAATFIISVDDLKIACDPALDPEATGRVEDPVYSDEDFENIDLWFITHAHEDHLDDIGLSKIESDSLIITHKIAVEMLQKTGSNNINVLKWKEKKDTTIAGFNISIEVIPAVHGVKLLTALLNGGVNGYWITLEKNDQSISIYITGDTVNKFVVLNSIRYRKADLFIPFIGEGRIPVPFLNILLGPCTLNARMLKRMKRIVDPDVTIPVHFGSFSYYSEPISVVEKWNDPSIKILEPGEEIVI